MGKKKSLKTYDKSFMNCEIAEKKRNRRKLKLKLLIN